MKDEDKKALAVGAGVAVAAALLLVRKTHAEPDKAILFGQVTDAETGDPVNNINVSCNGYIGKTNSAGSYRIINIEPGTYDVTFTDPYGQYATLVI